MCVYIYIYIYNGGSLWDPPAQLFAELLEARVPHTAEVSLTRVEIRTVGGPNGFVAPSRRAGLRRNTTTTKTTPTKNNALIHTNNNHHNDTTTTTNNNDNNDKHYFWEAREVRPSAKERASAP